MKLVRFVQPIARWKEPRAFVRRQHPPRLFFGWLQFRLFLYVVAGGFFCNEIAKLGPKSPMHGATAWTSLGLAVGFAVALIYGGPLLNPFAPSNVRLFPNFLTLTQGLFYSRCHPFPSLASYRFERDDSGGWILHLCDVFGSEAQVAVPTDLAKAEVETAFARVHVPREGLSPQAAAARREAISYFNEQARMNRVANGKAACGTMPRILAFCFGMFGVLLACMYLEARRVLSDSGVSAVCLILMVFLFAGIFWMNRIETRMFRKLVGDKRIICPTCAKPALRAANQAVPSYSLSLSCPYCGASLVR